MAPKIRMVVMRGTDAGRRTIDVQTDVRSSKVAELHRDPKASLLFWDADNRVQVRIDCLASLHLPGTTEADISLASIPEVGRTKYRQVQGSGTTIADPADLALDPDPTSAQRHFALIRLKVERIDWLQDKGKDSARAEILYDQSLSHARWLAP